MLILAIRTDKPEAEIGLFQDQKQLVYEMWQAHRLLAETLHRKISSVIDSQSQSLGDIGGIICYKGPGSFTGLRIGVSTINALAFGLQVPVIGRSGEDWCSRALEAILSGHDDGIVLPEYGSPVHITTPRK